MLDRPSVLSNIFGCLPSHIVWLKSSDVEANRQSRRKVLSWSSQEKLNLSQLPFLLSSPSEKYACVEILNCPTVVLTLVNVPPTPSPAPPLVPVLSPSAGSPPPSGVRRQRRRPPTVRYPMSVSRLAVRVVGGGAPSPKTTRALRTSADPSLKSAGVGPNDNARFEFQRGTREATLRVAAPAASCFPQRVRLICTVFALFLSPQMCCVQT